MANKMFFKCKTSLHTGLKKLGAFFGIWSEENENQEKEIWEKKVHTKLKNGEFGIPLNIESRKKKEKLSDEVEKYLSKVVSTDLLLHQDKSAHGKSSSKHFDLLHIKEHDSHIEIDESQLYTKILNDSSEELLSSNIQTKLDCKSSSSSTYYNVLEYVSSSASTHCYAFENDPNCSSTCHKDLENHPSCSSTCHNDLDNHPNCCSTCHNDLENHPTCSSTCDNDLENHRSCSSTCHNDLEDHPTCSITCDDDIGNHPSCSITCDNDLENHPTCSSTCDNDLENHPTCSSTCDNDLENHPTCSITCDNDLENYAGYSDLYNNTLHCHQICPNTSTYVCCPDRVTERMQTSANSFNSIINETNSVMTDKNQSANETIPEGEGSEQKIQQVSSKKITFVKKQSGNGSIVNSPTVGKETHNANGTNIINLEMKDKEFKTSEQENEINQDEIFDTLHVTLFSEDSTDSGKNDHEQLQELSEDDFLYGGDAYRHYNLFVQMENKLKIQELEDAKNRVREKIEWRIRQIDEILQKARAYYKKPYGSAEKEWRKLRKNIDRESQESSKSHTNIRFKLANLHTHRPIFTILISFFQIVAIGIACGIGGITSIGFEPQLQLMNGISTTRGLETIHTWYKPNVWIGPSERQIIGLGAFFAPCARDDIGIQLATLKYNYTVSDPLGCCEMMSRNSAATTTRDECDTFTNGGGTWQSGKLCSERPAGQNNILHNLKPCCIDLKGTCQLLTHTHCAFLGGVFHKTGKENCRQVNCIAEICKPGEMETDSDRPWLSVGPSQWWRLPLSLLLHDGIIYGLLIVIAQVVIVRQIERTIGWLRVMIVYLLSGCAGLIMASIFSPYKPHVGSLGSLSGILGLLLVELIQFWKILERPLLELLKLLGVLTLFFFCGTLPYVDNYTILAGLVLGILCACILLPYITISAVHTRCRLLLIFICFTAIIITYFVLLHIFYKVQTFQNCQICKWFNCVPYSGTMCVDSLDLAE